MFAEFVFTYVPFAIAAVILVPAVLVHVAMFIDAVRANRWKAAARAAKAPAIGSDSAAPAAIAAGSRPAGVRPEESPLPQPRAAPQARPAHATRAFTGGLGLRHGVAARRDHE